LIGVTCDVTADYLKGEDHEDGDINSEFVEDICDCSNNDSIIVGAMRCANVLCLPQ
jgi:hypothetical protein